MIEVNLLSYVLRFGTHRGQTVGHVLRKDAQYLLWAEGRGMIALSDVLRKAASVAADAQHREFMRERCDNEQCVEY